MVRAQDDKKARSVEDALGEVEAEERVIPIVEEQVHTGTIERRTRVIISKEVEEENELVTIPYFSDEVEVEHVPVNREVHEMPEVRREGDTTILPVVEEELVVSRRLMLKEEVHIRMKRNELEHKEAVRLRRERVNVKRVDLDDEHDSRNA